MLHVHELPRTPTYQTHELTNSLSPWKLYGSGIVSYTRTCTNTELRTHKLTNSWTHELANSHTHQVTNSNSRTHELAQFCCSRKLYGSRITSCTRTHTNMEMRTHELTNSRTCSALWLTRAIWLEHYFMHTNHLQRRRHACILRLLPHYSHYEYSR